MNGIDPDPSDASPRRLSALGLASLPTAARAQFNGDPFDPYRARIPLLVTADAEPVRAPGHGPTGDPARHGDRPGHRPIRVTPSSPSPSSAASRSAEASRLRTGLFGPIYSTHRPLRRGSRAYQPQSEADRRVPAEDQDTATTLRSGQRRDRPARATPN